MTTGYTIITKDATITRDGYLGESGIEICDHEDTISIDGAEHRKDDLIISDNEIESKLGDWSISW